MNYGTNQSPPISESRKQDTPNKHHSICAQDRHTVTVHGVTDVVSFDENGVFLLTLCGGLNLEGRELHVTVLNTVEGVVEVTGTLCGLLYYDTPPTDKKQPKAKRTIGKFFS